MKTLSIPVIDESEVREGHMYVESDLISGKVSYRFMFNEIKLLFDPTDKDDYEQDWSMDVEDRERLYDDD